MQFVNAQSCSVCCHCFRAAPNRKKYCNLQTSVVEYVNVGYTRELIGYLQWGTADAEIKDPSVENPDLKSSPFKAMLRLLQGIFSMLISTFQVHSPPFFQTSPKVFPRLLWLMQVSVRAYTIKQATLLINADECPRI